MQSESTSDHHDDEAKQKRMQVRRNVVLWVDDGSDEEAEDASADGLKTKKTWWVPLSPEADTDPT